MIFEYGNEDVTLENTFSENVDEQEIIEALIFDEVSHLPQEKIDEFCAPGGVGEQLVTEGKISRRTIVRLSKQDDLSRRRKQMILKIGKEKNDPDYHKAVMYREKERECLKRLEKKYGTKGEVLAKKAQKEYLHPASDKKILPASFMRAGGKERVGED